MWCLLATTTSPWQHDYKSTTDQSVILISLWSVPHSLYSILILHLTYSNSILTSTNTCSFWLVSRYEVCSTHLPAAIAARYFSLRLGLPTMTCVQLGENPWDEHTSPPSSSTMAEYNIRSCGLMEDNRTLGGSFGFSYYMNAKKKLNVSNSFLFYITDLLFIFVELVFSPCYRPCHNRYWSIIIIHYYIIIRITMRSCDCHVMHTMVYSTTTYLRNLFKIFSFSSLQQTQLHLQHYSTYSKVPRNIYESQGHCFQN